MLLELSIKDFAIIEGLNVSFGPGLNIFTGETGAGKSIILDAISLILGDRASNDIIRANKDEAQVEALFDITGNKNLSGVLKEAGIEAAKELVIKRVIQKAGRNKIYINGGLATLVTLTEVGRRLIDIYGQSEHQSLTRPEEHVEVLDAFGDFGKLRDYMADCHRAYVSLKKEYDSLSGDSKSSDEKRELIAFQLKEIEDAAISPNEDAELKKLKDKLQNSEKIKAVTAEAEQGLYSDPGSVIERLGSMIKALKEMAKVDDKLAKTADALEASLFQLEDSERFLRDYSDSIEADPDALEKVAARLDHVIKVKRKYGPEIEDVLGRKDSLEKELKGLSNFEGRLKELDSSVKAAREKAATAANNLSEARKAAAKEFEAKVQEELSTLGMKGSVFEVAIDAEKNPDGSPRFNEKGSDRVSFFISTNPGEGIKPLARIASGGELSRIMLSMKSVTASGRVPTLIFDEIDNGVGGAMAQVVGLKLKEVARSNQVLAITHLPQIAAFADRHYNVAKQAQGGRTVTSVRELSKEESVEHISVMLGGVKVTETSRKQAVELMESARSLSAGKTARKGK